MNLRVFFVKIYIQYKPEDVVRGKSTDRKAFFFKKSEIYFKIKFYSKKKK
jgi:hypothetical protein